jgi:Na+/proline symporter
MTSPAVPILIGGLFAWSIYRRVRRNVGQQKLRTRRAVTSIIILSAFSMVIIGTSLQNTHLLLGFGGGLLLGGLLGLVGLRLTRFETTAEGHCYTPNTHIGIALSILFVGRIAYKYIPRSNGAAAQNPALTFQNPLTLFILALTVGYYLVYQIGILIHNHDKNDSSKKTLPPPDQN